MFALFRHHIVISKLPKSPPDLSNLSSIFTATSNDNIKGLACRGLQRQTISSTVDNKNKCIYFQSLCLSPVDKPAQKLVRSFCLSTPCASKKSGAKPQKGKKGKSESVIDDLLDELSDDEEEENAANVSNSVERTDAATPAANFIANFEKHLGGKKSDKGKTKGGKGGSSVGHGLRVDYEDVKGVMDVEKYWNELTNFVSDQRHFFGQHLTLRSSNALDELEVDLEGDKFPLKEIATISKRDPKRLIIDSSTFPQATVNIMQTLRSSSLNLNPQQEGTRIYVAIPRVTRERREELAKSARIKLNQTKDELRHLQNKYVKRINDLELAGTSHIPKDHFVEAKKIIVAMEQHFIQEAEADTQKKQSDLLNKN